MGRLANPIGLCRDPLVSSVRVESPSELPVLVVQDHLLLGSAIAAILAGEADMRVCGIARTGAQASAVALRNNAKVVVMDFNLPDMSGPAAAAMIRVGVPEVAIVFHSAEDSEAALLDAIDAGALAYLTKSATAGQIVEAVRRAGRGEALIPPTLFAKAIARQRTLVAEAHNRSELTALLTAREQEVLNRLAKGDDTVTMARHLGVAPHTIEWHVRHVIEKLQVHSKLQAVIVAARLGLIDVTKP
jgi:two-component system, NarL family, nitrate/nitrite response regulator NarL